MKKGNKKPLKKYQDGGRVGSGLAKSIGGDSSATSKSYVAGAKSNYEKALTESKKADLMLAKLKGKKADLDIEKLKKSKPQYKKGGTKTSKKK